MRHIANVCKPLFAINLRLHKKEEKKMVNYADDSEFVSHHNLQFLKALLVT
jgi:hypothetical protein